MKTKIAMKMNSLHTLQFIPNTFNQTELYAQHVMPTKITGIIIDCKKAT